jgi:hypothetical protein
MSPLISRSLGVSANLDGRFLINVNFCHRGENFNPEGDHLHENNILEQIQSDIESYGIGKIGFNKRKNKQ